MNISNRVIGCAISVHSALVPGFLESVYANSLAHELIQNRIRFVRQQVFFVHYRDQIVGRFVADFLIEGQLILELKAINDLNAAAVAQTLNYLKASGLTVGLLMNFGQTKLQIKRLVHRLDVERSI